jgi:uncharacterized membrane protein YhhN
MELAMSVLCAAAVLALLRAEYRRERGLKVVSKTIASLAFVAVGLLRYHGTSSALPGETFLLDGLIFGALGDLLLVFQGPAFFFMGLVAFAIGHVGYIVAFAHVAPPASWLGLPVLLVAAFGASILSSLWAKLGGLRVPVAIYVVIICVMVVAAIAVYAAGAPDGPLIAVGAALFAISDVAVARGRFVEETFANKAWGLPSYYLAQLLIAWSIGV